MNKLIHPASLTRLRGFNPAVLTNASPWLFLAGHDADNAEVRLVASARMVTQSAQAWSNVRAVVAEVGEILADRVRFTVSVQDGNDDVATPKSPGEVPQRYFGASYPARALFEVAGFFQAPALREAQNTAMLHTQT